MARARAGGSIAPTQTTHLVLLGAQVRRAGAEELGAQHAVQPGVERGALGGGGGARARRGRGDGDAAKRALLAVGWVCWGVGFECRRVPGLASSAPYRAPDRANWVEQALCALPRERRAALACCARTSEATAGRARWHRSSACRLSLPVVCVCAPARRGGQSVRSSANPQRHARADQGALARAFERPLSPLSRARAARAPQQRRSLAAPQARRRQRAGAIDALPCVSTASESTQTWRRSKAGGRATACVSVRCWMLGMQRRACGVCESGAVSCGAAECFWDGNE